MSRSTLARTVLGTVLVASPACLSAQLPPPELISTRDLRVIAVPRDAPRATSGPEARSFDLRYEEVTVQEGQTLKDLLEERNIAPGGNVYGLIYAANPQVADVNRLSAGQTIYIPVLDQVETSGSVGANSLWKMEAYSELDAQAVEAFSTTQARIGRLQTEELSRLPAGEDRTRVEQTLARLRAAVKPDLVPASSAGPATLAVIYSYSNLAQELIDRIVAGREEGDHGVPVPSSSGNGTIPGPSLPSSGPGAPAPGGLRILAQQLDSLEEVTSELEAVGECIEGNIQCDVYTEVSTTQEGVVVPDLQLFAAPLYRAEIPSCRSDPQCTLPFRRLSSPAFTYLTVGVKWKVWAEVTQANEVGQISLTPSRGVANSFPMVVRIQR